jgi:glycosyltransferase involved in cell wall biosynthesis
LYQECSFFVSASKWEGFGLIFLEAAACSKPSIAYRIFSVPEVIQNNKTGFLVEDYAELKEKAEILIEDKSTRRRLGKNALSFSKQFDWDEKVEEYESIFLKVKSENENEKK